jgi:hypothetical protein
MINFNFFSINIYNGENGLNLFKLILRALGINI